MLNLEGMMIVAEATFVKIVYVTTKVRRRKGI